MYGVSLAVEKHYTIPSPRIHNSEVTITADMNRMRSRRAVLRGMAVVGSGTLVSRTATGSQSRSQQSPTEQTSVDWEHELAATGDRQFHAAIALGDGYLVAGETEPEEHEEVGYLVRLDGDGTVQWERTEDAVDRFSTLTTNPVGGFVAGSGRFSDNVLAAYESDGSVRWLRDTDHRRVDHVLALDDGTFAGVGRGSHEADQWVEYVRYDPVSKTVDGTTLGHNDDESQEILGVRNAGERGCHVLLQVGSDPVIELWKLATSGEVEWTESWELTGDYDVAPDFPAAETADGFLTVTNRATGGDLRGFAVDATNRSAQSITVPIDLDASVAIQSVEPTGDGGLVLFGTLSESREDVDPFVVHVGADREPTWYWRYDSEGYYNVEAATVGSTGDLVLAGTTRPTSDDPYSGWVGNVSVETATETPFEVPTPTDETDRPNSIQDTATPGVAGNENGTASASGDGFGLPTVGATAAVTLGYGIYRGRSKSGTQERN